jgi:hypothetical protein
VKYAKKHYGRVQACDGMEGFESMGSDLGDPLSRLPSSFAAAIFPQPLTRM